MGKRLKRRRPSGRGKRSPDSRIKGFERIRNPEFQAALGIFLFALLVRLLYLFDVTDAPTFNSPIIDSNTYLAMADSFAETKTITSEYFWQPFFYPFFLSLVSLFTGSALVVVRIIQIIVGAATCGMTYILARELLSRKYSIFAAIICSVYGPLIFFDGELLAATWAAFWAVVLVFLFIRAQKEGAFTYFFLLGICGALAILTRPTFLPFFLIGCAWMLLKLRKDHLHVHSVPFSLFILIVGFVLIVLPVCFLNSKITGKFGFLPYSGGINFYIGNNRDYCKTLTIRPGYDWDRLTQMPQENGVTGPWRQQKFFYENTLKFLKKNPAAFFSLVYRKAIQLVSSREIPRNIDIYLHRKWSILLKGTVWKFSGFGFPFGLVFPLALVGLVFHWKKIPRPLILFIVFYSLSVILVFVSSRYRLPLVPILSILASLGVFTFIRELSDRWWSHVVLIGFIVIATMLLCVIPGPFCEEEPNYEAEMYYALAHRQGEKGNLQEAIRFYNLALEKNPRLHDAHNNLGAALVNLGNTDKGIAHFERVLSSLPEREDVHNNLGMALAQKKQFELAITHYKKAIRINPYFTEAYYNLANCLANTGEEEKAIENYKLATCSKPDYVKAYYNLANLYSSREEWNKAAKQYLNALRYDSENLDAINNLATVYLMQKNLTDAERYYNEVLRINPYFAPSQFGLGNVFYNKGDYENARYHYEQAVRSDPLFAQAHYKLGNVLERKGKIKEAVKEYEEAIGIIPGWDKPLNDLAWILATNDDKKINNPERAVHLARTLCENTAFENPVYMDTLAAAYARAGQFKQAIDTAEKALNLARISNNILLKDDIQQRCKLYKSNQPFVIATETFSTPTLE